jgi:hypothetical protein
MPLKPSLMAAKPAGFARQDLIAGQAEISNGRHPAVPNITPGLVRTASACSLLDRSRVLGQFDHALPLSGLRCRTRGPRPAIARRPIFTRA